MSHEAQPEARPKMPLSYKGFLLVFRRYTEFGHSLDEMEVFYDFYLEGFNHGKEVFE
jgi:hypothetical protein